jgi:glycosyltransferase involved in cell wall biosynthesis
MKRNICFFVIDLFDRGGLQRVTVDIANKLSLYCNVHVVTFSNQQNAELPFKFSKEVQLTYIQPPNRIKSVYRLVNILNIMFFLRNYNKKHNIHSFISVGMASVIWSFISIIANKTKFICWDHTSYLRKESWAIKGRFLSKLFADNIIILTNNDAKLWNNKKVSVIYNPSHFGFEQSDELLTKIPKKNQIISLGRFVEVKGLDRLLDIWKIINYKKNDSYTLRIIGEGPLKPHLEHRILSENIKNITIEPFVKNPEKLYAESKIQVLTSLYEGLSMVLIEGLIFKVPAISFKVPSGPEEVIEDSITGFLINNNDIEAFADKLILLMSDEKLQHQLSFNCSESRLRFSNDHIINQWIELLEVYKNPK